MSAEQRLGARNYLIAIAATVVAMLLRGLMDPWLGQTVLFTTQYAAVAVAVYFGGQRCAWVAVGLGLLACDYFFIEPRNSLMIHKVQDFIGLALYLLTCAIIVGLGEVMRRARAVSESSRRRLEMETKVRLAAEAAEREQLARWRVTLTSIGDAVITTDSAGRVTFLNAVAESLTGWNLDEVVGKPLDTVFHIVNEQSREPMANPATRVLAEGVIVGLANHTVLIAKDGGERPIDDSAAPIRDQAGNIIGCVLVFRDVSERRHLERQLQERLASARLLAAIIESSSDAIISKSSDGIIQSWNAGAERLFGYTAEQAIGRHVSFMFPPDRLDEEDLIFAQLHAGKMVAHFETERVRSDGTRIPISLTISPVRDEAGHIIGASKIARDISDRKQAEARITREIKERQEAEAAERRQLEQWRVTLSSIGDGVITTDKAGRVTFLNAVAESLTGWNNDDAQGEPLVEVFRIVNEDTRAVVDNPALRAIQEGAIVGLANHTVLIAKSGDERPIDDSAAPIRDEGGQVIGSVLVFRDISERKRQDEIRLREQQRTESALKDADRQKDEFLATLSHELRTPLTAVLGWARLIQKNPADEKTVNEGISVIARNAKVQVDLIADLLDMSRIISGKIRLEIEDVQLPLLVRAAIDSVRQSAEAKQISIEAELTPIAEPVRGDPSRLQQIVWNLLANAVKFTPIGGRIRVAIIPRDTHAEISVSDTGQGIDPAFLPFLFERFRQADSSAARVHGGLGLGLSIVKQLVELHGGHVCAESDGVGQGSTFRVELPLATTDRTESRHSPADVVPPMTDGSGVPDLKGLKVLAIDDEGDTRVLLKRILEDAQAEVLTAASANEALQLLEQHTPDVLLSDIGMPENDGYELVRAVRASGKTIPAIAVTAFARSEDRAHALAAGYQAHVSKPIEPNELVATVARVGKPSHIAR